MDDRRSSSASSPGKAPSVGRSAAGCVVCRSRKVRCDKGLPQCRNCVRLGVACPGYETESRSMSRAQMLQSTRSIFREAGVEQRRMGSCEACRATKSRCTRTKPTCKRCEVKQLNCSYSASGSRATERHDLEVGESPRADGTAFVVAPGFEDVSFDLYSTKLPEDVELRLRLVNTFFDRIHPLRCLSFIHKPSFIRAFHRASINQDYGEPLLYAICALGARQIYLDAIRKQGATDVQYAVPGDGWAEKARKEALSEAHVPSVQDVMTLILLCQHALQAERHSLAFFLSGCVYRSMRLLGIDAPHKPTPSTPEPDFLTGEIENRIVWACYTLDVLTSSGVDKNSSWRETIPELPLPVAHQDFLSQSRPPRRVYLSVVEEQGILDDIGHIGLSALITVIKRLRCRVLRLIRSKSTLTTPIHHPDSAFVLLMSELDAFGQVIPVKFHLSDLNIYTLKDQQLVGAVFSLHFFYHAAVFDLTRIALAGFNFPMTTAMRSSPTDFQAQCQQRCHYHAKEVSNLIRIGLSYHFGYEPFDDAFCSDATLESAKVQIIYSATVDNSPLCVDAAKHNVRTALKLLKVLHIGRQGDSPYVRTILSLCRVFGLRDIVEEEKGTMLPSDSTAEVTGPAEIDHLGNMAPFRRARSEIRAHQMSASPRTLPSSDTQRSNAARAMAQASPPTVGTTSAMSHPQPMQMTTNDGSMGGMASADEQYTDSSIAMTLANMAQPTMQDYIRTADEMTNLLTWDMSELSEAPPWMGLDWDFQDYVPQ